MSGPNHNFTIEDANLIHQSTAPISAPGALAVGNSEILAGIVLAPLARPGAQVVYGSTSCPMDMKTIVAILSAPETLWLSKGALSLADFYNPPCRTGGSLTDAQALAGLRVPAVNAQSLDNVITQIYKFVIPAKAGIHAFLR